MAVWDLWILGRLGFWIQGFTACALGFRELKGYRISGLGKKLYIVLGLLLCQSTPVRINSTRKRHVLLPGPVNPGFHYEG